MGSTLTGLAYWAVYVSSWVVLLRALGARGVRPRPTPAGVVLWSAVAVSSVVGLVWPVWLAVGERELEPVLRGQVWRLGTSFFLQDGGVPGTVFNLVALAPTLLLVGSLVRQRTLVLGFLAAGVGCNVLTLALLGQGGAGNSMATMCTAAATAAFVALGREGSRPSRIALGVLALVALGLDLVPDQHGPATTAGLLVGTALALLARRPGRGVGTT